MKGFSELLSILVVEVGEVSSSNDKMLLYNKK